MTKPTHKREYILLLIPIAGVLLYVLLYVVSAQLYPGGSQADKNSVGFSWMNNYWCNLLNEYAINGEVNPAKPVAMAGMFILCFTVTFFWFLFSKYVVQNKLLKFIIPVSGLLSMATASLLFTNLSHDFIINLASAFGLIAIAGTFAGLYKMRWFGHFAFGFLVMLLAALNNYLYYTEGLLMYLPLTQKISFGVFLIWMCSIDFNIYRKVKGNSLRRND